MSTFSPFNELNTSPMTKSGELIFSRTGSITQKQGDKLVIIDGSYTIDIPEVLNILKWLDEQAPLLASTNSLSRASEHMRDALHDIWGGLEQQGRAE